MSELDYNITTSASPNETVDSLVERIDNDADFSY